MAQRAGASKVTTENRDGTTFEAAVVLTAMTVKLGRLGRASWLMVGGGANFGGGGRFSGGGGGGGLTSSMIFVSIGALITSTILWPRPFTRAYPRAT